MKRNLTRRQFLSRVASAVGAAEAGLVLAAESHDSPHAAPKAAVTTTTSSPTVHAPVSRGARSQVFEFRSPRLVVNQIIHEKLLGELIEQAVCHVSGKQQMADAWRVFFNDQDTIGIKFNGSGADGLATTEPFAQVLVKSLVRSGWAPEKLVLIEVDHRLAQRLKTQPRQLGWRAQPTDFGSGTDNFASVLDQVTAILNVPFLKANKIAGMSGCMKNLSHALVKHPSHYHENHEPAPKLGVLKAGHHCAPYIGDILATPLIRGKLRLHLMNALRTLREPMFDPTGSAVEPYGAILAGRDPVAVDMVGLEILNGLRRDNGDRPLADPDTPLPQHQAAARAGLGFWHPDFVVHHVLKP